MKKKVETLNIDYSKLAETKNTIKKERTAYHHKKQQDILGTLPASSARQLKLSSEKGVSCWLTTLPLKDYGFSMNKREFQDAIALRYNFKISDMSRICGCNQRNSINHSLEWTCSPEGE